MLKDYMKLTGIRHGQRKRSVVSEVPVKLVFEFTTPYRFTSCAIAERISLQTTILCDTRATWDKFTIEVGLMGIAMYPSSKRKCFIIWKEY